MTYANSSVITWLRLCIQKPFGNFLANNVFKFGWRFYRLIYNGVSIFAVSNNAAPRCWTIQLYAYSSAVVVLIHNSADSPAQVIPLRGLFSVYECHAVVTATHGIKHDLLQAKAQPAVRGFNKRGAENVVFVLLQSFLNTGNLLLACIGRSRFLLLQQVG